MMRSLTFWMVVVVTWSSLALAAVTQNSIIVGAVMNFLVLCGAGLALGVGAAIEHKATRASSITFGLTVCLLYYFAFGGSTYFRLAILLRYIEGDFKLPDRFFGEVSKDWKQDIISVFLIPLIAGASSLLAVPLFLRGGEIKKQDSKQTEHSP